MKLYINQMKINFKNFSSEMSRRFRREKILNSLNWIVLKLMINIDWSISQWIYYCIYNIAVFTIEGGPFGTLVTFGICNYISDLVGWEYAFYTTSAIIFIFLLFWIFLAYETPEDHPNISAKEKNYIKEQIGTTVTTDKV